MQLLNITAGGNYTSISRSTSECRPHRDPQDPSHRHGLEITEGSILNVFMETVKSANSNHHILDEPAPGFIVIARCPDGVIEAIEYNEDGWVAMGTQFHPKAPSATAMDFRIIEEFLDEVRVESGLALAAA